jgi:hypothetical protein
MPTDYIRYDLLVQEALRSVVRKVLGDAARGGLPGEHHFNIAFKTQSPGVVIPPAVLQRYPDEMAIILQHEFWDLEVTNDAFAVSLNFSRKPERLTIPFDSITGFSDPSVPFGFKLEPRSVTEPVTAPAPPREAARKSDPSVMAASTAAPAKAGAASAKSAEAATKKAERSREADPAKVVSIDAFRHKK